MFHMTDRPKTKLPICALFGEKCSFYAAKNSEKAVKPGVSGSSLDG
jgi:hypothetical protein